VPAAEIRPVRNPTRNSLPTLGPTSCKVDKVINGKNSKAARFSHVESLSSQGEDCCLLGSAGSDAEMGVVRHNVSQYFVEPGQYTCPSNRPHGSSKTIIVNVNGGSELGVSQCASGMAISRVKLKVRRNQRPAGEPFLQGILNERQRRKQIGFWVKSADHMNLQKAKTDGREYNPNLYVPKRSDRTRQTMERRALVSIRVQILAHGVHLLAATLSFDHGHHVPTTKGAGECCLLVKHGHRSHESCGEDLEHHTSQGGFWHSQRSSRDD
jgi:hypothetical protein